MNKIGFKDVENICECEFILDDTIIYNKCYKDENIDELNSLTFDDCVFFKCVFLKNINNTIFTNCKFINCDFSNVEVSKCGLHFITIIDSKMVGTNFIDSSIRNSIIENNLSNMIYFSNCIINSVEFKENNMVNCTFQLIKLDKVKFINNKMNEIEIISTSLKNIDLSTNDIRGIKISLNDIKHSIIDYNQIYDLINLLEIKIK